MKRMSALRERVHQRGRGLGRGRHRPPERQGEGDLAVVADSAGDELLVQQQDALAGRGRALEGCAADADDDAALREARNGVAHPHGALERVELVARLGQAGRCAEVVVGSQRDDQDVGLVRARVGRDAPRLGIDRGDRLPQQADTRLDEVAIRQPDGLGRLAAEHDVELRVPEDEAVGLVDQRHVDLVAQRLGQRRRELEAAEARSQYQHSIGHAADCLAPGRVACRPSALRRTGAGSRPRPGAPPNPSEIQMRRTRACVVSHDSPRSRMIGGALACDDHDADGQPHEHRGDRDVGDGQREVRDATDVGAAHRSHRQQREQQALGAPEAEQSRHRARSSGSHVAKALT